MTPEVPSVCVLKALDPGQRGTPGGIFGESSKPGEVCVPGSQTPLRIGTLGDSEMTSTSALSTAAIRTSGGTGHRCWLTFSR